MADVTLKNGKIVVIVDKKKYPTSVVVKPEDSVQAIQTKIMTAMGQVASKDSGALDLQKKKADLAKKLYEQAQGKAKETAPKEKKEEKKPEAGKKKEEKAKEEKAKEPKKEKAKEEKPIAEAVPKTKIMTIAISQPTIDKTLSTVTKKADKKAMKEIQKLAGSFGSVKAYVEKNAAAVTAAVFNAFYARPGFEMYLNSAVENKDFETILGYMVENKKGMSGKEDKPLIDAANNAIRGYLLFAAKNNTKFSEEAGHLGGIKEKGTMDGNLFMLSLLSLRREKSPNAPALKLELIEKLPMQEEKAQPAKVKYRI
ncbi:hypothetical protein H0O02_01320 [Candidatus Micrarchaeota archaeon]|nr:hypothetical protein [Candidatus Micrarchaeota archaeon]